MVFTVLQRKFDTLGINADQAKKTDLFNTKITLGFIVLSFDVFFQYSYIVNEAQGFQQYTESIYMSSIATASLLFLATIVFKMDKFFELIEWVEVLLIESDKDQGNLKLITD